MALDQQQVTRISVETRMLLDMARKTSYNCCLCKQIRYYFYNSALPHFTCKVCFKEHISKQNTSYVYVAVKTLICLDIWDTYKYTNHQQMHKENFIINRNTLLHVSNLLGHLQGELFFTVTLRLHFTVQ
jgi:hypothetical protein